MAPDGGGFSSSMGGRKTTEYTDNTADANLFSSSMGGRKAFPISFMGMAGGVQFLHGR